mmetsp:Transcript_20403/g.30069  ORF Transcript_20403/g.30069 Transcript_20403/m.30069 type:complete len:426 (-) Transcript_20403:2319-3596(-)
MTRSQNYVLLLICFSLLLLSNTVTSFSLQMVQQRQQQQQEKNSLPSSTKLSNLHRRLTKISNNNNNSKDQTATKITTTDAMYRTYCPRCSRPLVSCLCSALPTDAPFDTPNISILVLQHPQERRKSQTSTVPLVELCMKNIKVVRGVKFDEDNCAELKQAFEMEENKEGRKVLFLYPGKDAISLERFFTELRDEEETKIVNNDDSYSATNSKNSIPVQKDGNISNNKNGYLLILVDGTWPQAHGIISHSPSLFKFQQVMFDTPTTSIFHSIRREPAIHCTSTLETISRAIRIVNNGSGESSSNEAMYAADAMEDALRRMVEIQQQFALDFKTSDPRYKRKKMEKKKKMNMEEGGTVMIEKEAENRKDSSTSTTKSYTRQQRKALRYVPPSKRRLAQLTLEEKKKDPKYDVDDDDRTNFIYIAHMG